MAIEFEFHKKHGNFSLDVSFGSLSRRIGILGSSGSGKSMILKSIAGIAECDSGFVEIDGKILFDSEKKINVGIQQRKTGYLFQNYALFPNMTVAQNISCAVRLGKSEKETEVNRLLRQFELLGLEHLYPGELSGGQQQRVALARIIASSPDVILLDEPFSALDAYLKEKLQMELFSFLENYSGTVILVSHDRDEIYRFCDELLVIDTGKAVCSGKEQEVLNTPGYNSAAILTGCKNIVEAERMNENRLMAKDWDCTLSFREKIPEKTKYIGYRAHDFVPHWGNPAPDERMADPSPR